MQELDTAILMAIINRLLKNSMLFNNLLSNCSKTLRFSTQLQKLRNVEKAAFGFFNILLKRLRNWDSGCQTG